MRTMILAVSLLAAAFVGNAYASGARIDVTKVEASSQYPNDSATYHPENTIDGDSSTAWFPQRTERANKGEWIKFYFDGKPTLDKFVITNGWVKNDAVWRGNSRIAKARLTFSDGSDRVVMLFDVKKPIEIDLKNKTTEWMRLTIETIYAGQQWNTESGITDVAFFGQAPVVESKGGGLSAGMAAADVRPPGAALNGGFRWSPETIQKGVGFVILENLVWEDQPIVARQASAWVRAKQRCRALKVEADGLVIGGFDLPTMKEHRGVIEGRLSGGFSHHAPASQEYWSADTGSNIGGQLAATIRGTYSYANKRRYTTDRYHARCVSQGGDLFAKPVFQIAQALAESEIEKASRPTLPDRPVRNPHAAEPVLERGEFEPSAEFQKRVAAERDKVRKSNAAVDMSYEQALKDWEARAEQLKRQHAQGAAARENGKEAAYLDAMAKAAALKYGTPVIKAMHYDADAQAFRIEIGSERGGYAGTTHMPVPLALAPRLKELATRNTFKPDLEMRVADSGMVVDGIRQLRDPAGYIVATEFEFKKDSPEALRNMLATYPDTVHTQKVVARIDELEFAKARDSVAELEAFVRARPKSALAGQAKARIKELKYAQVLEQTEAAERQKRVAAERERESRLYNAPKNTGDKVCADITTRGLFSSDTYEVSGYVEGKSGNRIQIRIANPRGINSYNGSKLYQGAIIWDQHSNWKDCP